MLFSYVHNILIRFDVIAPIVVFIIFAYVHYVASKKKKIIRKFILAKISVFKFNKFDAINLIS